MEDGRWKTLGGEWKEGAGLGGFSQQLSEQNRATPTSGDGAATAAACAGD